MKKDMKKDMYDITTEIAKEIVRRTFIKNDTKITKEEKEMLISSIDVELFKMYYNCTFPK